jgi:hypothetical protein
VSVATDQDGSSLLLGTAFAGVNHTAVRQPPVLCRSTPLPLSWWTDFRSVEYWVVWVAFGAWALQFNSFYLINGWWMILVAFWLTTNSVRPAHLIPGRLRLPAVAATTIVAAFLIYGTFEWLERILEGWSWGPPGQWLRIVALPLQAIAASVLTAIALVPQLRRHLGPHAVPLLILAALSVGIADFGVLLSSPTHWREHWKASCIELFAALILPLILAATSERLKTLRWPDGRWLVGAAKVWRGEAPTWVALLIVYPLTMTWVYWLNAGINDLPSHGYSDWEYATRKAVGWILLVLVLIIGSGITWRCLDRGVRNGRRSARWLQGIIAVVATPFLLSTLFGEGFLAGNILTNSAKAALGSAYDMRAPDHGIELRLSGEVTYGLADRLKHELETHPGVARIRLESPGGDVNEASRAAEIIARHQLDTVVSSDCESACTIMFLAGKHRILEMEGRIGFHAAKYPDPTDGADGVFGRALVPFGVDQGFIARVEATKPPKMWYPTWEELVAAGVLTVTPGKSAAAIHSSAGVGPLTHYQ